MRMSVGVAFAGQENTDPVVHIRVARCREGRYIMVYLPVRQTLYLDVSGLASDRLRLTAYDPEAGEVVDRIDFDMPAASGEYSNNVSVAPSVAGHAVVHPPARIGHVHRHRRTLNHPPHEPRRP